MVIRSATSASENFFAFSIAASPSSMPHDPAEVKGRLRGVPRIGLVPALDLAPATPQGPSAAPRTPRRRVALLERGDARGVIAAEAVAHDHDLLRIDIRRARRHTRKRPCPALRNRDGRRVRAAAATRPAPARRSRAYASRARQTRGRRTARSFPCSCPCRRTPPRSARVPLTPGAFMNSAGSVAFSYGTSTRSMLG